LSLNKFLLTALLAIFWCIIVCAQKTDTIHLSNGDRITCEIKELEYGKVRLKTNDLGTIRVEWDAVTSIYSDKMFELRLLDGSIIERTFDTTTYASPIPDFDQIKEISQIRNRFWNRFDGGVDLGFNYTSSNDILQFSIEGDATYRYYRNHLKIKGASLLSIDSDSDKTRKKELQLSNDHFLNKNNLWRVLMGVEQNTQLGIQQRWYVGGGIVKDFLHTQKAILFTGLGVLANREKSTDDLIDPQSNAEIVGIIEFRKFSFDYPEMDINAQSQLYTGITEWGRFRMETSVSAKIEIINDFFLGLNFYYDFDNQPIDDSAGKNDFRVTTSIGYTF